MINAGQSPEAAERFQRETALLAELRHPGIVRFVASGATPDGQAYLVMEWLEGESLVDRLARGTLSVPETIDLGRRIASALSVAHARNVVHRDLKPGNLFLPGRDLANVIILDFGIARVVSGGQSLTSTGATLGSPGYLSPEQARGTKDLDTRADVFSLGCVLFRCLTGRAPFTGDLIQVMMQTVMDPAPRAGSLREGTPPALEDLLQRMLAKSPDGRPRDANAVAAELAALVPPSGPGAGPHRSLAAAEQGGGTVALSSMLEPPSPLAPRPAASYPPGPPAPPAPSAPPTPPAPRVSVVPQAPQRAFPSSPPPASAPPPALTPHAIRSCRPCRATQGPAPGDRARRAG